MKKNIFIKILSLIAVLTIGGLIVSTSYVDKTSLGAESSINYIKTISSNTAVSVTTSASVNLLPASSGRIYAIIVNSGADPVWLSLGSNATASSGIYLAPTGGTYVVNFDDLFVGAINAISTTGTSIVTVTASQ